MKRAAIIFLAVTVLLGMPGCTREDVFPRDSDRPQGQPDKELTGTDLEDFRIVLDGREYYAVSSYGTDITVFIPEKTNLGALVAKYRTLPSSVVTVGGKVQENGVTANDFGSWKAGVKYRVKADDGKTKDYTVYVLDTRLPVVAVETKTAKKISSKTTWREATMRIRTAEGAFRETGGISIRGRGNWTWDKYPKKPYAVKLDASQALLGMPAHKRWILLAMYRGFIGNAMAFEATRRAPSMEWAPRGQYVELVLNGKYQGLYYLCEHIKIDQDRVNIAKLTKEDVQAPAVTGGYLLEYDELYDEEYKFRSASFNLPVQLKSPDEEVPDAQFNYIRTFINDMEAEIKKIGTGKESRYADYLDAENFADYWMVLETVNNYEAYKPRSVKMFKGRDGVDSPPGTVCKLKAGPLWDQELFLVDHQFNSRDMYYYKYLFKDPAFVAIVKERWKVYKSNIQGNTEFKPYLDYLDDIVTEIERSAKRDISLWGNEYFTLQGEVRTVKGGFQSKIDWMDRQIDNL